MAAGFLARTRSWFRSINAPRQHSQVQHSQVLPGSIVVAGRPQQEELRVHAPLVSLYPLPMVSSVSPRLPPLGSTDAVTLQLPGPRPEPETASAMTAPHQDAAASSLFEQPRMPEAFIRQLNAGALTNQPCTGHLFVIL
ncbi:hypothetical protein MRX96_033324 [Rhipicephalus microplus]